MWGEGTGGKPLEARRRRGSCGARPAGTGAAGGTAAGLPRYPPDKGSGGENEILRGKTLHRGAEPVPHQRGRPQKQRAAHAAKGGIQTPAGRSKAKAACKAKGIHRGADPRREQNGRGQRKGAKRRGGHRESKNQQSKTRHKKISFPRRRRKGVFPVGCV